MPAPDHVTPAALPLSVYDPPVTPDGVKLSVSLSPAEVAILDAYARAAGLASRSAALQHAVRLLEHDRLEQDYAVAFDEWDTTGEQALWDDTASDGLVRASR